MSDDIYTRSINESKLKKQPSEEIARKIYLTYPNNAFKSNQEAQYEILNAISLHFGIPLYCVHVVGSSKTGYSAHKNREFQIGESDLDIAIISEHLFKKYMEVCFKITDGLTNTSGFKDSSDVSSYNKYINKGIFRPDKMPRCPEKTDWFKFFNRLSQNYIEMFKNINAGIYFSQTFFEFKQRETIKKYK